MVLFCGGLHGENNCRISSAEVVPFLLVINLFKEHARMEQLSAVRNPQLFSLVTGTKEHRFFLSYHINLNSSYLFPSNTSKF